MGRAEYWDILEKDGTKTGERIKREYFTKMPPGKYHLVVHIWIVNSKGELLLQRRSPNCRPMAGEWAATGGSVMSGEESRAAAVRELYEELSISLFEKEITFFKRLVRKNSIADIWRAKLDVDCKMLDLPNDEVQEAKWVTLEEFEEMIKTKKFHNYGKEYFDCIRELCKG